MATGIDAAVNGGRDLWVKSSDEVGKTSACWGDNEGWDAVAKAWCGVTAAVHGILTTTDGPWPVWM